MDSSAADSDPAELIRTEVRHLAQAYSNRMLPTEFFSHTTAATLWGVPLPRLEDRLIDVSVFRPRRAPKGAGVRGHTLDPNLVHVTTHRGLRLATPASTWANLGPLLHPYDLVAAGDAIVCQRTSAGGSGVTQPPIATLDQLRAAIDAGRRPGVGALRDALGRIRTGSWSRLETWVRLILVDAGLPEPVLNFDAFADAGSFLGCVDLAYPDLKIAIEYEGAHHWQTPEQIQRDIDRLERLVENGWRIVRLTKRHVFSDPAEVVRRVSVARTQRAAQR
ncbi:endonuclease domain-containing protein [Mycetocola manganoxydans]|uniref:endonuclease domain-containing protein n=1 Tax=Mycetocola manganoxydans TaxID=699879 RepID=UPI001600A0C2|nr:DUF559 domain-containing protein [Mycetocola manganoxydans]GHD41301.1 hypothetical protein GCM10008097_05800 [Mycetocola manganoxydans]